MDKKDDLQRIELHKKKFPHKLLTIISLCLLVICFITSYIFLTKSNNEIISLQEITDEQKVLILEQENTIIGIQDEIEKLKNELSKEQNLTQQMFCRNLYSDYLFEGIDFQYSGNISMHRELIKFVENLGKEIISSDWNLIWNNVDVAMHKITVKDNIRFYFITYFNDTEFETKNSIYWVDEGCFLDYPSFTLSPISEEILEN